MDRIFLAVIVSSLLLATTSTALLVVSGDGPITVAAMNPQGMRGRLMPLPVEQQTLPRPEGGGGAQTSF